MTVDNLPGGTIEYTVKCPKYSVDPSLVALDEDGFQTVEVKPGQERFVKVTMVPK